MRSAASCGIFRTLLRLFIELKLRGLSILFSSSLKGKVYVCKACVNKLSSSLLHFADAAPVEFLILFTNYISLLAFASRNIDRARKALKNSFPFS